ncbi:MAG TPA: dUTP diphosphatase [Gemmatimonadaceae bacterium]
MNHTITLELLHQDARAPERATEGSAGYDLFAYLTGRTVIFSDGTSVKEGAAQRDDRGSYFVLEPQVTARIPLGFKARLPGGYEAQIRPRSGNAFKRALLVPNAPGTVDADFPDEWQVLIMNAGRVPVRIEHGERIAQMVLSKFEALPFEFGAVRQTTSRTGGFGSTGA